MRQKIYFDLDHISAIHVTMERESSYMRFDEVPSKALDWAEGIIIKSGKKLEAVIYE